MHACMNIDARTRSPQQQEVLRQTAIRLRDQGKTFREIGEYLGVHPLTVGRWYQRYQEGGMDAISVKKKRP